MNRNVKLLLAASILIHSGVNLLAPVYAIFLQRIDATLFETGVAVGIYTIFRGTLYLTLRRVPERSVSRRAMMAAGYSTMCLGYLGYLGVSSVVQVFVLQVLISVGEALVTPSWSATIANSLTAGRERELYASFYGYRSLFEGAAAIAGGYFAMVLGFQIVFSLMAFCALASAGLALCVVENRLETQGTPA